VRVKNAEPYSLCSSNFDHIVAVCEQSVFTATMLSDICRVTLFVADVKCNWLILSREN
jgi:enamine deaminase RidA (YjgF/YER057c/UK114 family)